jgi:hypothetical protein
MSGRLSGVVSLTDILNLFARASGLQPSDPEEARRGGAVVLVVVVGLVEGLWLRRGREEFDSARSSVVDVREKR